MTRFVLLEHDYPHLHWDLMLEVGDGLRTWRLSLPPGSGQPTVAEPLSLHRLEYLDYEGPVSGNRGTVRRWDFGSFSWQHDEPIDIEVELSGQKLVGRLRLTLEGPGWKVDWRPSG